MGARGADQPCDTETGVLVRYSRRAMACEFAVLLDPVRYPHAAQTALTALNEVDRLEELLSIFRPSSQISRINAQAHRQPVPVAAEVMEVLQMAMEIWRRSGGAFDIATGALSRCWGFVRRQGRMPRPEELRQALAQSGSQHLKLHPQEDTVELIQEGVELNLGSIGKGFALDQAAQVLKHQGVEDFLIHGGQSSVLVHGGADPSQPERGWLLGVAHPLRPQLRLARIRVVNAALGTSGSGTQFFVHQGQRYCHVLDPRTGWPVQGVFSVTVRAPSAALADAWATALFVLGPEKAGEVLAQEKHIAALMLYEVPQGGYRLQAWGFAPEELELLEPYDQWLSRPSPSAS